VLDGKLGNVYINYASTQPVILTNAQSLTLAKSGKGSVFIGTLFSSVHTRVKHPILPTASFAVSYEISLHVWLSA
jgi:hypothetical protein